MLMRSPIACYANSMACCGCEMWRFSLSRESPHLPTPPPASQLEGSLQPLPPPPRPLAASIAVAASTWATFNFQHNKGEAPILIVAHATWGKPRRLIVACATWMCMCPLQCLRCRRSPLAAAPSPPSAPGSRHMGRATPRHGEAPQSHSAS